VSSLNFLEDQGIALIRPVGLDADIPESSPMSEAEVLFALQVYFSLSCVWFIFSLFWTINLQNYPKQGNDGFEC
jgi:hypothetical protein